jgi:transcription termination/antitermination protein NusG
MQLEWRAPAHGAIDCPLIDPNEWFAVQVWAGREARSAGFLALRGYDVFLPCYRERRRLADRIRTYERALFAGYLFCRMQSHVYAKILTAPGVIRIVGGLEGPIPIPQMEIMAIRRIVDAHLQAEPWPFLEPGQHVRIDAGPLRGTEGTVLTVNDRRKLIVSISLLQRAVAVEIDPEWIAPCGSVPMLMRHA